MNKQFRIMVLEDDAEDCLLFQELVMQLFPDFDVSTATSLPDPFPTVDAIIVSGSVSSQWDAKAISTNNIWTAIPSILYTRQDPFFPSSEDDFPFDRVVEKTNLESMEQAIEAAVQLVEERAQLKTVH